MFEYDRNLPQNKIGEKEFFWVEDHLKVEIFSDF